MSKSLLVLHAHVKGFYKLSHRQEHFGLHCCVIYYFNGRLVFILLFGEPCIASGTSGLEFYGTVFTLGAQGPGIPELVVFFPPSFLFFLFNSFSKLYCLLKASFGLECFPCSPVSYSWGKHWWYVYVFILQWRFNLRGSLQILLLSRTVPLLEFL